MPLSRWLGLIDEENEQEKQEAKAQIEEQMLIRMNELEAWYSKSGEYFEAILMEEQRQAMTDILNAEGDQLVLARERAKMAKRLLMRKSNLEQDLEKLRAERNALEE